MRWRVFHFGGRPRLAIPDGPQALRKAAVKRYQPTTWRKSGYQRGVKLAVSLGLDRFIARSTSRPIDEPTDFDLDQWTKHIAGELECSGAYDPCPRLYAAVVWPPQHDRVRMYVHLLDETGRAIGFAKISFDETNDRFLDNEARMLSTLRGLDLKQTCQPKVLSHGRLGKYMHLVLEPIPENAKPIRISPDELHRIAEEYAGEPRTVSRAELESLDWWRGFEAIAPSMPVFAEAVRATVQDGLRVCRVHGDLGPANLVRTMEGGNRLWLFDWEHSSEAGPIMTDRICTWFAPHHRLIRSRPEEAAKRFAVDFGLHEPTKAGQALAGLAYLCAMAHGSALTIASHLLATACIVGHHGRSKRDRELSPPDR